MVYCLQYASNSQLHQLRVNAVDVIVAATDMIVAAIQLQDHHYQGRMLPS